MDRDKPGKPRRRDILRDLAVLGALAVGTGAARAVYGATQLRRMFKEQTGMTHVVLLGDSSLDNQAYVSRGQAVIDHLRRVALKDWQVTLLAVDGSRTGGVARQLAQVPAGATHLVLSIGGNDALGYQGILQERAKSTIDVIGRLADIQEEFAERYDAMLRAVLAQRLPTTLCTIYRPNFPDPIVQRLATTASTVFNDVILRAAFASGLPMIDLRLLFDEEADYANAIEPSSAGGAKIARSVVRVVQEHDFGNGRSEVFV
jgi:hypothetical protein